MKFFKYISALALGALALTSCSSNDDEDKSYNTNAGVGVSVESAEMTVNESRGIFRVPIVVTGDANGYIAVRVKITGTGNPNQEQAIADSHFYLTSNVIYIPKDSKVGNVEIRTQYLPQRDNDRYFNVVIESAEGATVQPLNTTTICIQDRLSSPIYRLSGPWNLQYADYDGAEQNVVSNFNVIDEATGECEFVAFAPQLMSDLNLPVVYRENTTSGEWELSIVLGETLATVNFVGLGECEVRVTDTTGRTGGELKGEWNADHTTVTFPAGIVLAVYSQGANQGTWERFTNLRFSPQAGN